jgi:DNA polymerase III subunit epsilon
VTRVDGVVLAGGLVDRRAPWRRIPYAALDLETTGLDPERDAVVSFGVVPVDQGRVRLDLSDYREVKPSADAASRAVAIHGLRPVDLAEAPTFEQVADDLRSALWRRVVIAWSSWVEASFLARTLGGRKGSWERHIVDVRRLVLWLDALDGRGHGAAADTTLAQNAERFGVPLERAHHALWDAFVTAQLFLVLASRLEAHGVTRLGPLLRSGQTRLRR